MCYAATLLCRALLDDNMIIHPITHCCRGPQHSTPPQTTPHRITPHCNTPHHTALHSKPPCLRWADDAVLHALHTDRACRQIPQGDRHHLGQARQFNIYIYIYICVCVYIYIYTHMLYICTYILYSHVNYTSC